LAQPIFLLEIGTQLVPSEKSSKFFWAVSATLQKLSKVKNCPIGENSPNLATLFVTTFSELYKRGRLSAQAYSRLEADPQPRTLTGTRWRPEVDGPWLFWLPPVA
jgi:hypothetical protein